MPLPTNPYTAGDPVGKTPYFVGRADVLREVERVLRAPNQNAITLHGQRRIGKTSVLQYLEAHLPELGNYHPVYFDLMNQTGMTLDGIILNLARTITLRLKLPDPALGDTPTSNFQTEFLPRCLATLPADASLVLLLDEFDMLADPQAEQQIKTRFFGYLRDLRHLDQRRLQFVFVLGRNVDDLDVVARGLFKDIQSSRVSLFSENDAESLVRLSELDNSLAWSAEAIQIVWQLTSGHPYLTQALCHQVWENAYEESKTPIIVHPKDVECAVQGAIQRSQNMFTWLWDGLGPAEKVAAAALAGAGQAIVDEDRLGQILAESGVRILIGELRNAPRKLKDWDILTPANGGYIFRVEILRRWITENKPISRTWEELDRINPVADNLYNAAYGLYRANNLPRAASLLSQALDNNPNHLHAMELLAEILLTIGELGQAQSLLEQLLEFNPAKARYRLKQVYLKQAEHEGQETEKLIWFQKAQNLAPDDQHIGEARNATYRKIGADYERQGDLPKALEAYLKADDHERIAIIHTRMRELEIQNALNEIKLLKLKRSYQKAYQRVLDFVELYPDSYDWQTELNWLEQAGLMDGKYRQSLSALEQDDRETAKRLLAEVISIDPDYKQASRYMHLAVTGDDPQAIKKALSDIKSQTMPYPVVPPQKTIPKKSSQQQLKPIPKKTTKTSQMNSNPRNLSQWNLLDALMVLWWVGTSPEVINTYKKRYGQNSLEPIGKILSYTLIFLPLLMPAIGMGFGLLLEDQVDSGYILLSFGGAGLLFWLLLWLLVNEMNDLMNLLAIIFVGVLSIFITSNVAGSMAVGGIIIVASSAAVVVALVLGSGVEIAMAVVVASCIIGGVMSEWVGGGSIEAGVIVIMAFYVFGLFNKDIRSESLILGLVLGLIIGMGLGLYSGWWFANDWMKSLASIFIGCAMGGVAVGFKNRIKNKKAIPWALVMLVLSWFSLAFLSAGGLTWLLRGTWPVASWPF